MDLGTGTAWAVLSAVGGGSLAKGIEWLVRYKTKKIDVGGELRDDLFEQVKDLETRLRGVREESDAWRKRYYDQYEAYINQRALLKRYESRYGTIDPSSPRV